MFNYILDFIKSFMPYISSGKNNNVYAVIKGKEIKLNRRIKGLTVKFYGNNNTVKLHLPIKFSGTVIRFDGDGSSFEMMPTSTKVNDAGFSLSHNSHIFIDSNSRLNRPNLRLIVNNNKKEESNNLYIGKNAQISIDVLMRTSDGHSLFNIGEELPYNKPRDIIIGDNVWLGSRVVLLKGTVLPNNSIVGACSVVNSRFDEENVIIAGHPARIVKRNVKWERAPYGEYIAQFTNINNPVTNTLKTEKYILLSKLKRKKRELLFKMFY